MTNSDATNPDGSFSAADEYSVADEDQLQAEDTLIDRGVDDVLDEGISPPERPYSGRTFGRDDLDHRLAEEEPDGSSAEDDPEFPSQESEAGRTRSGRLVEPNMGFGEDSEADLVADDVGISGGAASAEEAAVHIIEDE